MATFAVDSKRQVMVATGIVEPVAEWGVGPDGKRFRTDAQAVDDKSGLPLWGVEVTYRHSAWGRESTVTAKVSVPVEKEPAPGFFTPITFRGLVAEVRVNRQTGVLSESWRAEGIESMTSASGVASAPVSSAPAAPSSGAGKGDGGK